MNEKEINLNAEQLRSAAKPGMNGINEKAVQEVYDISNKFQSQAELNQLGSSLEKGNSTTGLTTAPQAHIERDSNHDVTAIEFHAGALDFGFDHHFIRIGALSKQLGFRDDYIVSSGRGRLK